LAPGLSDRGEPIALGPPMGFAVKSDKGPV
jgi:hypothetical protein